MKLQKIAILLGLFTVFFPSSIWAHGQDSMVQGALLIFALINLVVFALILGKYWSLVTFLEVIIWAVLYETAITAWLLLGFFIGGKYESKAPDSAGFPEWILLLIWVIALLVNSLILRKILSRKRIVKPPQ